MAKVGELSNSVFGVFIIITLILIPAKAETHLRSTPLVQKEQGNTPHGEVEALREVAKQIGKTDWMKLTSDPCRNDSEWSQPYKKGSSYQNRVECDCSFRGVCHIVQLFINGQDLSGNLPTSIAKLPNLKILDLSMNCFTGNIPHEWASTNLEHLSLYVNNLTGQLPGYLGNITSLTYLSVESNQFTGSVPYELGQLSNMKYLFLTANNFTGELPSSLSNLKELKIFIINSNTFSGRIPDFIDSWKNIEQLWMLASGLEGPIPENISVLTNLTDLGISDLKGRGSKFPALQNLRKIQNLILRNCNLSGPIPNYIMQMGSLKSLDLSFNRLRGGLPTDYTNLSSLENMYLTDNLLTGPIPNWLLENNTKKFIDISYNNFDEDSFLERKCKPNYQINLFKSSRMNIDAVDQCFTCSKEQSSLHINCGGPKTTINGIVYEEDQIDATPAAFQPKDWGAVSSTGHFWAILDNSTYIAKNTSVLRIPDSALYQNARLTPLSLKYYMSCLVNGNYSVKLRFAEIMIQDNRSFYSFVGRVFDVYVQNQPALKDFDIIKAAGGADKPFIHTSYADVTDNTLEIRFYWAGRGITTGPMRGIYGPLISAIDVEPSPSISDFKSHSRSWKLVIAGLVVFVVLLIFINTGILWWKGLLGGRTSWEQELVGLDPQTIFSFRQIKAATNDFDEANKIGEGGFGPVHKGTLSDGTLVAVKQLSSKSRQGNREFLNEVGMITALQHPNLVRLYGCCVEGYQLLLIYEYMENNSLARALFDRGEEQLLRLDWCTRQKICVGMAKGLAFLHEESALKIVHRDIKPTNVLLDGDLNPKISDFGLAKLDEEENTHISTRVAGTIGYMAPEYALWGHLTDKADVYSFGVVALEIVAGQSNMKNQQGQSYVCLIDYALVLQQKGNLLELIDPRLGSEFNEEEVIRMVKIALLCTNPSPAYRPMMSKVVSMLEGQTDVPEVIKESSVHCDELRFEAMRYQFEQLSRSSASEIQASRSSASESQPLVHSTADSIRVGSSSSTSGYDLYPLST